MNQFRDVSIEEMNQVVGGSFWSSLWAVTKTVAILGISIFGAVQLFADKRS